MGQRTLLGRAVKAWQGKDIVLAREEAVIEQTKMTTSCKQCWWKGGSWCCWCCTRCAKLAAFFCRVGGPLPTQWYEQQWQLQKQIVARQEELGVHSLLPAFQGNVPDDLLLVYPTANISNGWLDCFDPLFTTIADAVMQELIADFGPTHYYQADGFFDHSTGPWVDAVRRRRRTHSPSETGSAGCDFGPALHGMYLAGCSDHCKAFTDLSSAQSACAQQPDCTGITLSGPGSYELRSGLNPAPSPSNETAWMLTNPDACHGVPASSADAHARATLVYGTMTKHDPAAVWVYQGWIWLDLDSLSGMSVCWRAVLAKGYTYCAHEGGACASCTCELVWIGGWCLTAAH